MPNIAEIKEIIDLTPLKQNILIVSRHGCGKSEVLKQIYEEQGYSIITLFLGQSADASDVLGLPDRTEVEFKYGGTIVKQKITEMCVPKWWPRDDEAKLMFFLDELNRAKPEIYNCIMDLVLNKALLGVKLPTHTRIIGAMNPSTDDAEYDVQELDPAFLSRWNVYQFVPSVDEWISYAVKTKYNKQVIGFISKNTAELDPPTAISNKSGEKYPDRRSWERVSDIMNAHPNIFEKNAKLFQTMIQGIIGQGTAAKFCHYIRENAKGISPDDW